MLTALHNIHLSPSNLDARIQALENLPSLVPNTATASTTPASPPTLSLLPCGTLATALPAPTAGAPFFPPAAAISPHLRTQILAGNNINLVKILLGSEVQEKCMVDCGDVSVLLKDNDLRLSNRLTMPEFNVAFGVFREVICDVYPERRAGLDTYLAIISDLAMTYGGTLFYEYHKSFSAKSAMYIQWLNQRLDWSAVALALISRHFAGHRVLSCSLCGTFTHTPSLCQVNPMIHSPMCYNFNENVCTFRTAEMGIQNPFVPVECMLPPKRESKANACQNPRTRRSTE
ncbi:hypothetical protein Q7C36_011101 [Tachysurus vachellii]|uniref:Uncharacterized protein n=1 Tax=Tachysurus vachellii TaxID=175792 RepID=A0AA88MW58_TACVA|nr:hypothetical protein Q7C36_011101 [Tachysurus vachellii]